MHCFDTGAHAYQILSRNPSKVQILARRTIFVYGACAPVTVTRFGLSWWNNLDCAV